MSFKKIPTVLSCGKQGHSEVAKALQTLYLSELTEDGDGIMPTRNEKEQSSQEGINTN